MKTHHTLCTAFGPDRVFPPSGALPGFVRHEWDGHVFRVREVQPTTTATAYQAEITKQKPPPPPPPSPPPLALTFSPSTRPLPGEKVRAARWKKKLYIYLFKMYTIYMMPHNTGRKKLALKRQ